MKKLFERQQRTIARPAVVRGVGYVTGQDVTLRFTPAHVGSGVVFARTDLGPSARLAAHVRNVTGTQRRTTLGHAPVCVSLVEHVLAALAGLRIDNCLVELNAPEPPGLDGSARPFVAALVQAGLVVQPAKKSVWAVDKPITVEHNDATLTLHPPTAQEFQASYLLDYGARSPIVRQRYSATVTPQSFMHDIAPCRTFVTQEEAVMLRQQGLGVRTGVSDLLIFGPQGPIENKLLFGNEPARHKVLDMIGDLSLVGEEFCGHLVAYRSGHPLNVELARTLHERFQNMQIPLAA